MPSVKVSPHLNIQPSYYYWEEAMTYDTRWKVRLEFTTPATRTRNQLHTLRDVRRLIDFMSLGECSRARPMLNLARPVKVNFALTN